MPPQLRGVRVIRDGRVVSEGPEPNIDERAAPAGGQDVRAPAAAIARDLRVGDRVRLLSFGSTGIIDQIRGDEAEVRVGSLHLREKLANLELVDAVDKKNAGSERGTGPPVREGSGADRTRAALRRSAQTTEVHLRSKESDHSTGAELNLIGKNTDEAVDLTDKFLDEVFLEGVIEVRIIHGHGTGALRRAIAQMLTGHPHVARFKPAPQDQGGAGATIVELRT